MKPILKIFNKTFVRIPKMQQRLKRIQNGIKQIDEYYNLQQRARLLYLSKLIIEQVIQIQGKKSIQIINRFNQQYFNINYNYSKSMFQMEKNIRNYHVKYQVKSMFIEQFDHPFFRQTLYFHQLKNIDKYMDIEVPTYLPKYVQDGYRQSAIDNALDKQNPLGVPHWSKPLCITVQVNKGDKQCGFDIFSKLGKTMIHRCYNKKTQYEYETQPKYFNQSTYQFIIQFLNHHAGINRFEIQQMHKLTYIGGSIEKLQLMINLFDTFSSEHIQL